MRIPEFLFPVINRVMRLLLHSPLHRLMSGNIMVVYFRGRRTGRAGWTPVRYLPEGEGGVLCLRRLAPLSHTFRLLFYWKTHGFRRHAVAVIGARRLTGRETGWWPNLLEPAPVELQLAGRRMAATAQALPDDAERKNAALRRMLGRFPADAAYHRIAARRGQPISDEQYRQAVARDVLVVFELKEEG